ncbi:zinc finger and BTB domain-containing protein 16 [Hypomesus transpacificus]|uniref:zinc finger and BTB domain-containing protein 16 n=1 Tax=Hypomesus transpacificus TaxID=137520 RepID=UPI001F082E09|nr:zinc finger and BTB domain-containing protein 16 [Hypomesus transpacificus]XP_046894289.1 zinc finger and BTB domain-containing protein 16 [Hypomesus transpacificus]XP_046894298.1 zinc finger and BTB domain-containing protein 16 [Hypomesus transpacificus]
MVRLHNVQYSSFLQQADTLRGSGSLCDAVISVDGRAFRAHRLVLACASRRLARLLGQGGAVDQPVSCTLDLSPDTFQQLLDFSYSQALEVPPSDLQQLLRAAQLLEMRPLEEQCRSQLDALERRAGQAEHTKETGEEVETGGSEERDEGQASRGGFVPKGEPQDGAPSPPGKEHEGGAVRETTPAAQTKGSSPPPLKKRPLVVLPTPVSTPSRDSVIASTATCHGARSPSRYRWHSVNTLRRMSLSYSDLVASQPFHRSQQFVPYSFPLSAQHMYPLLASPFPAQVHNPFVGYPSIIHPDTHSILAGSPELGDILKQELERKPDTSEKVLMGEEQEERPRFHEELADRALRTQGCQLCSRSFQERPWLHASPTARSVASVGCGFCGQGYKLEPSLRPQRRGHGLEKPYQCKSCPKKFSLKHQLDTHHRVHTGEKPFECRLCGQRSRDYSAMIKHLRTHGGATPYQCTACLEYCSSLAIMQKHLKEHPLQDFPSDWTINRTYLYTSHT